VSEPDKSEALEVRNDAEITGGAPPNVAPSMEELLFLEALYAGFRLAGVVEITCSKATFLAHLNYEVIWAGPWKINITSMAYGDVKMYGINGRFLGTCTVSNLALNTH